MFPSYMLHEQAYSSYFPTSLSLIFLCMNKVHIKILQLSTSLMIKPFLAVFKSEKYNIAVLSFFSPLFLRYITIQILNLFFYLCNKYHFTVLLFLVFICECHFFSLQFTLLCYMSQIK